jgi:hypothetical protein
MLTYTKAKPDEFYKISFDDQELKASALQTREEANAFNIL